MLHFSIKLEFCFSENRLDPNGAAMRLASFALEKYFCTFANHQGLFFVFFFFCFFGFLENYSAHPRGAVEVTVTDGKREACCHREKVRERKKKEL